MQTFTKKDLGQGPGVKFVASGKEKMLRSNKHSGATISIKSVEWSAG